MNYPDQSRRIWPWDKKSHLFYEFSIFFRCKKRFAGGGGSLFFIGATQKLFIGYLGDVYIFKFPATSFWEKWNVYWFEIILFYEHYHEAKVASCRYIFKENNSNIGYFAIHFPTS